MGNLTKRELVMRISNELGMQKGKVHDVLQRTLDGVTSALARNQRVEFRDFGVFEVKILKARVGRNPKFPEVDFPVPPHPVVKFKMGQNVKARLIRLTPQLFREKGL